MNQDVTEQQILMARASLWTSDLDKLLRRWKKQVGKRQNGHLDSSRSANKKHWFYAIPSGLLQTIIATGLFATYKDCTGEECDSNETTRLILAIFGVIAVVMSFLTTMMNYQKDSEEHKTAADKLGSLHRQIDSLLLIPGTVRGDPIGVLNDIRNKYDEMVRYSPTLGKEYDADLSYDSARPTSACSNCRKMSTCSVQTMEEVVVDEEGSSEEVSIHLDLDCEQNYDAQKAAIAAANLAKTQNFNQRMLDLQLDRLNKHSDGDVSEI